MYLYHQVLFVSVLVNLYLFFSIFEIHFQHSIVQVDRHFRLNAEAPFKRVLIFSADGLRAETFIRHPEFRPYMRDLINTESCAWGVVQVDKQVSPDLRPGHTAMFAGTHEDPSAIFFGRKENPVPIDTIFNHTSYAVGIGTYDDIKKFANDKMLAITAKDKLEKRLLFFNAYAAKALDLWVVQNFTRMLKDGMIPDSGQLLIFLNFISPDVMARAYLPESEEYKKAMEWVDSLVNETQTMVEKYFKDNDTLFVLTGDQGVSNDDMGTDEDTQVPFVIWGKGVKNTGTHHYLNQVDFAALLAGALGISFPSNSIGRFPDYFWNDKHFVLEALMANLHQLYELMMTKKRIVESRRNFPIFGSHNEDKITNFITTGVKGDLTQKTIGEVNEAISLTLKGIAYYEHYDWRLTATFVVTTVVCWMIIVAVLIVKMSWSYDAFQNVKLIRLDCMIKALLFAVFIICVLIGWSYRRIPYGFLPIYLILILRRLTRKGIASTSTRPIAVYPREALRYPKVSLVFLLLFTVIGAEILAFSFEKRRVLILGLLISALWCALTLKGARKLDKIAFFVAVSLTSVFPLMPVVVVGAEENLLFMTAAPIITVFAISILLLFHKRKELQKHRDLILFQILSLLSISTSLLVDIPTDNLIRKIAWLSLFLSYILPLLVSAEMVFLRLISLFLGIAYSLSVMSFSYEVLFLLCLFLLLFFLLKLEMSGESSLTDFMTLKMERKKNWDNGSLHYALKTAWLYLFFITFSFFVTENISNVNFRDPTGITSERFVRILGPWLKVVLFTKVMAPLFLVSCFFRILHLSWSKFQVERNFLIVLLLCHGITLHTFLGVKHEGTWLDIWTSVWYHVIASVAPFVLVMLHYVTGLILSCEPRRLFNYSFPSFSRRNVKAPLVFMIILLIYFV